MHLFTILLFACTGDNALKTYNDRPVALITSHSDGFSLEEAVPVEFRAQISDSNDPTEDLLSSWHMNNNLVCDWTAPDEHGTSTCSITPTLDTNRVSVTVTDPENTAGIDEISIQVSPIVSCAVTSPTSGSIFNLGSILSFDATAGSNDDISLYTYEFSSDLDGVLYSDVIPDNGNISLSESNLSENMHQISLSILDQENVVCEDSIFIEIDPPYGKLVFVSSQRHLGDFGGAIGADSFCQNLASIAGLSGTFKAWLSESTYISSPAGRFIQSSIPYTLVNGTRIANDWSDLTDGSIQNPINIDEYGNASIAAMVFSFTQIDGSPGLFESSTSSCYGDDCNCNNWTNPNEQGSPPPGSAVGQTSITTDDWTDYSFGNFCGPSGYPVYCFEQ